MEFSVKIDHCPDGRWSWSVVHGVHANGMTIGCLGGAGTSAEALSSVVTSIGASLAGQVVQEARAQAGGIYDQIDAAVAPKAADDALDQSGLAGAWPSGVVNAAGLTQEQCETLKAGGITNTKMAWPVNVGTVEPGSVITATAAVAGGEPSVVGEWLIVPPDDAKTMRDAVIGDGTPQTQPGEQVLVGEVVQFDGQPPRFVVDEDTPASMLTPTQLTELTEQRRQRAQTPPVSMLRGHDGRPVFLTAADVENFAGWNLQDWQLRVLDERRQLRERLEKLEAFFTASSRVYMDLPSIEQKRLRDQFNAMSAYEDALTERIAAWVKA